MSDNSIVIHTMCGDGEVPNADRTYELYIADDEDSFNVKMLTEVLEKYNHHIGTNS